MNSNNRYITLEKLIDSFIKGRLTADEQNRMWELLLEHPEYLEHLRIEAALVEKLAQKSSSCNNDKSEKKANGKSPLHLLRRWFSIA